MTPKEKANEIVDQMFESIIIPSPDKADAINCAIICAKQVLEENSNHSDRAIYWQSVISELKNQLTERAN